MRATTLIFVCCSTLACAGDGPSALFRQRPVIGVYNVTPGPHNVLSAVVTAEVTNADSVAVEYGGSVGAAAVTPAVSEPQGPTAIAVLGLLPDTEYELRIVAWGDGVTRSPPFLHRTGALPDDLPQFVAEGTDPTPGFVVLASGKYALVIDNDGRVVWYRRFEDGAGLNFQAQPTGRYTLRPVSSDPWWLELDALGAVTRQLPCARGLTPRFHDMIVLPDGSYWIMCDETRTLDLTSIGGVAEAHVTGTVVQRIGAHGTLLFEWSPFGHFAITDLPAHERAGTVVNWTHGNAIDLDYDGNLIISFRSLNEVTKISTRTGAVMWRMGGVANQFAFIGAQNPPFSRQHGVRITAPGWLLLLDNLGDPASSRVEYYDFDEATRTALLEETYSSQPPVVAGLGGTAQPLTGGHTLVSFGNGGRVEEYGPGGTVVWRLISPGYVFRAQRIRSLYAPGVGTRR